MSEIVNLVVGAGLSGATIANRIAEELNEPVLIIDAKNHIGGNSYDYYDHNGICVHKYGTHIFHTDLKHVWSYLSKFTKWYPHMHKVKGIIDGMEVPIPFNLNTIHMVFPPRLASKLEEKLVERFGFNIKIPILKLREAKDKEISFLADYIYEKVFLNYTLKQWGMKPEDLDPSVTGRVPVYISRDDRYFQDYYQGIPANGYAAMITNMLDNPLITISLNTPYNTLQNIKYRRMFYTGPIDEFFDYKYGELPYRSVKLDFIEYDIEYFQSASVINYPCNYDFTRVGEYKYFLNNKSSRTVVSYEYPEQFERGKNERYYPIAEAGNQTLYDKYLNETGKLKNTYFLGRLGDYKYYDMDKAVERALNIFEEIK